MKKEIYKKAEMEIIFFENEDIITTSTINDPLPVGSEDNEMSIEN